MEALAFAVTASIARERVTRAVTLGLCGAAVTVVALSATARANGTPPPREKVYLTVDQALRKAFPDSDGFGRETHTLPPAVRTRLEKRLGFRLPAGEQAVYVAGSHTYHGGGARGAPPGAVDGYAVVIDEKGKYYPITFLVATDRDARVTSVQVLVYRERHGDAVRRDRFLKQFRGKGTDDRIAIDRDIVHVSGATISSWSLAAGVRRAVAVIDALYGPGAGAR